MGNSKEKVVCNSQPEELDLLGRWRDAFEGNNKELAFDLMNQVLDGKITNEAALALLDSMSD
jgi:predicted metal-dependent hydrolase